MTKRAEQDREQALADWRERYAPGTYGCHEALDRVSGLADQVAERVLDHPSVKGVPEWLELAERACDALGELYERIAERHMGEDDEEMTP